MPDSSTYSLSLPTRYRVGQPNTGALAAAAAVVAGLGLTIASVFVDFRPQAGSVPSRLQQVSSIATGPAESMTGEQVPAPLEQAESSSKDAPALIAETSSVVQVSSATDVQAPSTAAPVVPLQPQTAPAGAAVAPAPAPPPAAAQPRAGARWLADGFVFVTDGQDWDTDSLANVGSALAHIPQRIRTQLGNRSLGDISILVNRSGTSLSGKQPYGGAANFFSTNDGRNELVLFPGQSVLTIMHELGHAYNLRRIPAGRYALALLDPEMQSFMAATGWRVLSTPEQVRAARDQIEVQYAYGGSFTWPRVSHNDPLEDFANSFALYYFAPGDLQEKSPERFAWFEANLGR
jgi:hypothetical protein